MPNVIINMKQYRQSPNFDQNKLTYNTLLINGYNSYENKDFQKALRYYQEAQQISTDSISSPLIKSIMGVIHMHNCNYTQAIALFDAGLKQLKTNKFTTTLSDDAQYQVSAVTIKLQANLALCYLVLGQYREAIDQVEHCLDLLNQASDKNVKNLYQSLVYIFYRFYNFSAMRNADFDNLQTKYDDYSQACFYSTMAINKQLCESPEQAFALQKKALEIWTSRKEIGYMLVTVQHLLVLAKELNLGKKTITQYQRFIADLMNSQQLQGISQKTLFKGFNEKMKCAKTITTKLIQFQKDELKYRDVQQLQLRDWKIATKIKLQKAIGLSQSKIKTVDSKQRKELALAIQQMKQTLVSMENQSNILIQRNLQRSKFVIDAVNSFNKLKSLITRTGNIIQLHSKQNKRKAFEALLNYDESPPMPPESKFTQRQKGTPKVNQMYSSEYEPMNRPTYKKNQYQSQFPKSKNKTENASFQQQEQWQKYPKNVKTLDSKISKVAATNPNKQIQKYNSKNYKSNNTSVIADPTQRMKKKVLKFLQLAEQGQYFLKRNFSSDGGQEKWILLTKSQIRWSTDESKISKKGQYQSYQLKDIKGILYGKQSQTFNKSCNKHLVPWRCFTLVLQKRTFDLCSQSDQDITVWIPALTYAIKKNNTENKTFIGYTPGRLLWKKMWLLLTHHFIQPPKKHDKRTYYFTRAQALRRFQKAGYTLPRKK